MSEKLPTIRKALLPKPLTPVELVPANRDIQLSKNSTKSVEFKPTNNMKIWVATSVQLRTENIAKIAQECGVDRKNWYLWIKKPGFLEWYADELERSVVLMRQQLDNIGLRMAEKDFRYFEAMQKVVGRDLSEKDAAQPSSPVQINFNPSKFIKNRE